MPEEPAPPTQAPEPAPVEPEPPVEPPEDEPVILAEDAPPPTAEDAPPSPSPPSPSPSSEPVLPTKAEPDFKYTAARTLIGEQLKFLRGACMKKGKKPLSRITLHYDVQPGGKARLKVYAPYREVRDCVQQNMRFPFPKTARGGAFNYIVTETTGTLHEVPVDPTFVQVPAP